MRLGHLDFKKRFVILGIVFFLGYALLLVVAGRTLTRVMINGDLYRQVVQDKDLIADILPPPLYVVDTYLTAYQIANETDADIRKLLVRQLTLGIETYRERHAVWDAELEDPELRELLLEKSHEPATRFFTVLEEDFIPLAERSGTTSAKLREVIAQDLDPLFSRHRVQLLKAVPVTKARIADHEAEAAEAVSSGKFWSLVVAAGFIAVVGAAATFVILSILRSMNLIIGRVREMALADADLSARIEIRSRNEVGELAKWINSFVAKIAELVRAVKKSSIQLTSTATQVAATSHEQEATVHDFGASTNEIAAAVKEISATSTELTSTMREVDKLASRSAGIAAEGRSNLGDMQATMGQLADSSSSISSKLSVINEKANDITSVVTTITKVADQTNLLSVNAAIEAEKSGEYGRGFLVVARAIRRLADQTASATLDIEETVQHMQSAVSAGVMEMDKFSDQVRRSVDEVTGIGNQLGQIIEQVETLTGRFDTVTEGMTSQAEGARQIDEAMGSLAEGVKRTAGSLGEFTSAAEDMRNAVESLKLEISKFKLED
ncbi:MAG: methyl-accepting chemotaxis protein [Planctomycetota bacterium]|jgi:methyl-accepting chemotaxis protein WspA